MVAVAAWTANAGVGTGSGPAAVAGRSRARLDIKVERPKATVTASEPLSIHAIALDCTIAKATQSTTGRQSGRHMDETERGRPPVDLRAYGLDPKTENRSTGQNGREQCDESENHGNVAPDTSARIGRPLGAAYPLGTGRFRVSRRRAGI
mgnify:CR=1 FL=1